MPVMINARASMMEMVAVVHVGERMRIRMQRAEHLRTVHPAHHPSAASR